MKRIGNVATCERNSVEIGDFYLYDLLGNECFRLKNSMAIKKARKINELNKFCFLNYKREILTLTKIYVVLIRDCLVFCS